MDQATLVGQEIDDGQKLLAQLARSHFDVTAGAWIKSEERPRWYFYIASRAVEEKGLREATLKVDEELRRMPDLWVESFDIMLIGATDPVAKDMVAYRSQYPARRPIRFRGFRLGDLVVEEAFIYLPPSPGGLPDAAADKATTP